MNKRFIMLSEGRSQGSWNKCAHGAICRGRHLFMPRKPLTLTVAITLRAVDCGLVLNPQPTAPRRGRGLGQSPKVAQFGHNLPAACGGFRHQDRWML